MQPEILIFNGPTSRARAPSPKRSEILCAIGIDRAVAEAYLKYLYTKEAQVIIGQNHYRPRDPAIAAQFAAKFPKLKLFTIDDTFGGWTKAQATHFADGGVFDQIYTKK